MQSSVKKSRSVTIYVFIPLIMGLQIGWFMLQQRYVPEKERHNHPIVRLYKKYTSQ